VSAGPVRAKLFIGLLASAEDFLEKAKAEAVSRYGAIDLQSPAFLFDYTTYYNEEMGNRILRQFVSFDNPFDPGELGRVKRETIAIEKSLSVRDKRRANLDPGYVNLSSVVLATTKDASYRVYLGDSLYGQPTLFYRKGEFLPFDWTYKDYREKESVSFFGEVRRRFKEQMRGQGLSPGRGEREE
jgi:hypothetical protein